MKKKEKNYKKKLSLQSQYTGLYSRKCNFQVRSVFYENGKSSNSGHLEQNPWGPHGGAFALWCFV